MLSLEVPASIWAWRVVLILAFQGHLSACQTLGHRVRSTLKGQNRSRSSLQGLALSPRWLLSSYQLFPVPRPIQEQRSVRAGCAQTLAPVLGLSSQLLCV